VSADTVLVRNLKNSRDGINHVQAHLHTTVSVVCLGLCQAGYTVITVPQNLDTQAVVFLRPEGGMEVRGEKRKCNYK
jgi:hypothetical protein